MTLTPSENAMVHRLRSAVTSEDERPISFVLGAGISIGATPSTAEMVDYFKKAMSKDPEDQGDLENLLNRTAKHDEYQVAAQFVIERAGIARLNRAVRLAVLTARSPRVAPPLAARYLANVDELDQLDKDWRGWVIPRGLGALGRLLEMIPSESRGPILTTNFDPLIEASLRAAGLIPHRISSDVDGTLPPSPSVPNLVPVNHVHGYWNEGDTLHTGAQLTRPRPRLLGSLRQLLTRTTCVVLGYGGWDDLLTKSMLDLVEEGSQRDIEILWGCYGSTPQLGRLTDQTLPGRLQPYVGVDVNRLLPAVEQAVRDRLQPGRRRPIGGRVGSVTLQAFEDVDPQFIASHMARDSSPINAISYFDGRPPSWVDALGDRAPMLERTIEIENVLTGGHQTHLAYLLSGPTGEGKSTMLRQIAGRLAQSPTNRVLWMNAANGFDPREISGLTSTSSSVWVVIDDADVFANAVSVCIRQLDELERKDVRFLLAARDGDWLRATQLQSANVSSRLLKVFEVGGFTESDAEHITAAWARFGNRALGRLVSAPSGERAAALFEASRGASEGALLGAMLEIRYGNDFRQHIWEMMDRLSRVPLPEGQTLLSAYAAICVFHHHNISNLSLSQLSMWLRISESDVDGLVVYRLGREAAAERHGNKVIPRHRRIAQEVVDLLPEFDIKEEDLTRAVVTSVVQSARGSHWGEDILAIAYAGQRLTRKDLALAAADGAVSGDPYQLRLVNYRLNIYRNFDVIDAASAIAQEAWANLDGFSDVKLTLRRFLVSWSRTIGLAGEYRDSAALNACALLDATEMGDLSRDDATRALNGIAWSLGMLPDGVKHSTGRGACAESALYIAETPELREQAAHYLEDAEHDGYSKLDSARQRAAILATVRESIRNSRAAPARRFNAQSRSVSQLLGIVQL
ncbi:SIR2 family protein [Herbiconiux sp. P18]|uniref:P-loop NTPase n=1 Tax=Herbiconiux liangxiaofengii TaxID=3342795 RepID=UPI0035B99ACC